MFCLVYSLSPLLLLPQQYDSSLSLLISLILMILSETVSRRPCIYCASIFVVLLTSFATTLLPTSLLSLQRDMALGRWLTTAVLTKLNNLVL